MEAASSEESSLATNPTSLETLARLAVLLLSPRPLAWRRAGHAAAGGHESLRSWLIRCRARLLRLGTAHCKLLVRIFLASGPPGFEKFYASASFMMCKSSATFFSFLNVGLTSAFSTSLKASGLTSLSAFA